MYDSVADYTEVFQFNCLNGAVKRKVGAKGHRIKDSFYSRNGECFNVAASSATYNDQNVTRTNNSSNRDKSI